MKNLKIFAVILIMLGFAVNTAQSQGAWVENDFWRVLITKDGMYCADKTHFVLTPSGNLLLTATYQLKCDRLIPDKGVNKVDVFGTPLPILIGNIVKFQWGFFILHDADMIVTSNGKAKIVYHFKLCKCDCKCDCK